MIPIFAAAPTSPSIPGLASAGTVNPTLNQGTNSGADTSFLALLSEVAVALTGGSTEMPTLPKKMKLPTGTPAMAGQAVPMVPTPVNAAMNGNANNSAGTSKPTVQGALPMGADAPNANAPFAPSTAGATTPLPPGFFHVPVETATDNAEATDSAAAPAADGAGQAAAAPADNNATSNASDLAQESGLVSSLHRAGPAQLSAATPAAAPGTTAAPASEALLPWNGFGENMQVLGSSGPLNAKDPEEAKSSGPNANQGLEQTVGSVGASYAGPGSAVEAARPTAALTDQVHDRIVPNLDSLRQTGQVEVQMNLHPPELGQVQLHLALNDGQLSVHFVVQNDGAKAALDHQMEPLRARFAEMGLSMGQFDVRRDGGSNQEAAAEAEAPAQTAPSASKASVPMRKTYDPVANSTTAVDLMA